MSDDPRDITDDMLLSELTVGEFKQLMRELLNAAPPRPDDPADADDDSPPQVTVRRKSLDEFMSDLNK